MAAFREAEFATAVNVELAARRMFKRGLCWTPERAAEAFLGFDGAYRPARRRIWRILGVSEPIGIVLRPSHWTGTPRRAPKGTELPARRTNLILQFKCSHSRLGKKAIFGLWTPYLRFEVDAGGQHRVLQRLEASLPRGEAVVRYAAPAFVDRGTLIDLHLDHRVLNHSTFVPPSSIPDPHTAWAFQGPGLGGRPNPDGEIEPADEWADLEADAFQGSRPKTWGRFFSGLGRAGRDLLTRRDRARVEETIEELRAADTGLEPRTLEGLEHWLVFQRVIRRARSTWLIVEPAPELTIRTQLTRR